MWAHPNSLIILYMYVRFCTDVWDQTKNNKYHNVGAILKSNRKTINTIMLEKNNKYHNVGEKQ